MARVLIIDDRPEVRSVLRLALERAGYEVAEAVDGARGIRAHDRQPADLILCDIFMPDKEGLSTIRELRARHPGVKIVAMSGGSPRGLGDFLPMALDLGADAALHKPFALEALLDLARGLLASPGDQPGPG